MFEPRRNKDRLKSGVESEEVKEDKHLFKIGSIRPQKGHRLFKVVNGAIVDVEPEDYIENLAILRFIARNGVFGYTTSIKMREAVYVSALNKKTAVKHL